MEDKLFNKIKESSQLHSEYQMPDDALAGFREYTAKRDSPDSSYVKYIVLATLLSLLIGSNVFWYLRQANNTATNERTYPDVTTALNPINLATKTDTVYITKYVTESSEQSVPKGKTLITETEYFTFQKSKNQLKALQSSISNLAYKLSKLEGANKQKTPLGNVTTDVMQSSSLLKTRERQGAGIAMIDLESIEKLKELRFLDKLPISLLDHRPIANIKNSFSPIHLETPENRSLLKFIRPKTFSVFGQYGLHIEKGIDLDHMTGRHFDLGITTLLSSKIRIRASVEIAKSKAEFEDDYDLPSFIPSVSIPEGAILNEVYLSSKRISTAIGLDYLFKPRHIFRPYIGLSYNYGKQQYINIEYEYFLANGKLKLLADNSSRLSNRLIGLTIGSDINLSNNMDAFINLSGNYRLSGNINGIFQLNSGVTYHF